MRKVIHKGITAVLSTALAITSVNVVPVVNTKAALKEPQLKSTLAAGNGVCAYIDSEGALQLNNGTKVDNRFTSVDMDKEGKQQNLIAVAKDGSIYVKGDNSHGQLGTGNTSAVTQLTKKTLDVRIAAADLGDSFAAAIDSDGYIWTWGNAKDNRLGRGVADNALTPAELSCNKRFTSVSCGNGFAVALDTTGSVWFWGTLVGRSEAVPINLTGSTGRNFSYISAGDDHFIAICDDGTIWGMGDNTANQLGSACGNKATSLTQLSNTLFCQVACGNDYTVAIDKNGNLWSTGKNDKAQLFDKTTTNKTNFTQVTKDAIYTEVQAGADITIARRASGSVISAGAGSTNTTVVPGKSAKEETYSITFNSNGGSGSMDSIQASFDAKVKLPACSFTNNGYEFKGWSLTPTGSASIADSATITNEELTNTVWDKDLMLYAVWEAETYNVTINGVNVLTSLPVRYGDYPIDVPKDTQTFNVTLQDSSEGYPKALDSSNEFEGYYDEYGVKYFDSNGKAVKAWDKASDVTLVPHWKQNAVTLPTPSKDGFIFAGWSESPDAKMGVTLLYPTKNTTLYPVWITGSPTVIYNYAQNGGESSDITTATPTKGSQIDLKPKASKPGWNFIGWNTDPNATVASGNLTMGDNPITLYAIFTKAVKVSYLDGVGTRNKTYNIYNNESSVEEDLLEVRYMNGWSSVGWTQSNDDTTSVLNSLTVTPESRLELKAVYEKNYESKFIYGNGGTQSITKTNNIVMNIVNRNRKSNVTITAPSSSEISSFDNWEFIGWTPNSKAFNPDIKSGESMTVAGSANYYAVYKRDVTLTFDSAGGSEVKQQSSSQLYNTNLKTNTNFTLPSNVTKGGYSLTSWTLNGETYKPGSKVSLEAPTTATAVWSSANYRIHFDGNGATSGEMEDQNFSFDVAQKLSENKFKKEIKVTFEVDKDVKKPDELTVPVTFKGWLINGKEYANGAEVKNLATQSGNVVKAKAQWAYTSCTLPTLTKEGSTFSGWSDGKELYTGSFTPKSNVKLTAKWDLNKGDVVIKTGIASNPTLSIKPSYGKDMPTIKSFSRTETITFDYDGLKEKNETKKVAYTFKGIFSQENGKGTKYYDSSFKSATKWNETGNKAKTLYAYWVCEPVPLLKVEKEGYAIAGWYLNGKKVDDPFKTDKSVTLTLKYAMADYKINCDLRGGTCPAMPVGYKAGDSLTLPEPTKPGSIFQGWYTKDGKIITEIKSIDKGDISIYAVWADMGNPVSSHKDDETLKEFVVSSEVTSIPSETFSGCTNLSKVTINEGLSQICSKAFENCIALTEIVIPESCTFIGANTFKGCKSLKTITIKNPNCRIITGSETIPATTEINGWANSWTSIFADENKLKLNSVGTAKRIVINSGVYRDLIFCTDDYKLPGSIPIKSEVSKDPNFLGWYLTKGNLLCDGREDVSVLGKRIYAPNGFITYASLQVKNNITITAKWKNVVTVKKGDVNYKVNLETAKATVSSVAKSKASVTIPATVKYNGKVCKVVSISSRAFAGDKKLKSIVLGKNVRIVGSEAFKNCRKLKRVTCKRFIDGIGSNAFKGTKKNLIFKGCGSLAQKRKVLKNSGNSKIVIK